VIIQRDFPRFSDICNDPGGNCLVVCDEHTEALARNFTESSARVTLPPGEEYKNWEGVEAILREAAKRGLGRDGLFIGIGGGVITDLTAFAASIYMRGARLVLVPTTLLAMADAALGGKTGFDLEGLKNLAGSFYPAETIIIALEALTTLPEREWKSGMAELIKTAVLDRDSGTLKLLEDPRSLRCEPGPELEALLTRAVQIKGAVVEADPRETGTERALLNLGHTFGHALESAAGLGKLSHGEAVAWGMARSCEFGLELGISPPERVKIILDILEAWGYETRAPYPGLAIDTQRFHEALHADKKKKDGTLRFIVPDVERACSVAITKELEEKTESYLENLVV
jgi:3-dehydroquinate synthase